MTVKIIFGLTGFISEIAESITLIEGLVTAKFIAASSLLSNKRKRASLI
ncbi:MAG: hypothetical protein CM15mP101_00060 [Flavobacteriaceae bacterium]|nr:MAG: hypothetical protein CM15mP101_00060 [Flavobacteriaceae bacterium]